MQALSGVVDNPKSYWRTSVKTPGKLLYARVYIARNLRGSGLLTAFSLETIVRWVEDGICNLYID